MAIKLLSKKRTPTDYFDTEQNDNSPSCDKWRRSFCLTMLNWASNPDAIDIMQFCIKYKISRSSLHTWVKTYEDIASAFENMKLFIASNRRVGCMMRKFDRASAARDIHLLDPQEDEINKYHAELKKSKNPEVQTKYIIELKKPNVISAEELAEQNKARR